MYTNPSAIKVLQCVRESLDKDIMPELQTDRASVTPLMIQTMLCSVEKRIDVELQWMADECGRMRRLVNDMAEAFADSSSHEAAALRAIAKRASDLPEFASLPSSNDIHYAYSQASAAFTEAIGHLNELVGKGVERASTVLDRARAYIQLRIERDIAGLFAIEGGMVGRG